MTNILTHVHVYYARMWPEIETRLRNIAEPYDLFVTMPPENEPLRAGVLRFKPDAVVTVVENRGFDVAPFIDVLNRVDLNKYDYVVKLHTKRDMPAGSLVNGFDLSGEKWRRLSLRFLETRASFERVLRAFETDETLGMTGDYRLICRKDGKGERQAADDAAAVIERLGLPAGRYAYVMGTMFMTRAKLLAPLKRLNLTVADFAAGTQEDGRPQRGADPLPYALERVFGYLSGAQGRAVKDPLTPAARQFIAKSAAAVKNFLYRKKVANNKTVVKVCKVPVFVKRNGGGA